jgi:hypothetical protein
VRPGLQVSPDFFHLMMNDGKHVQYTLITPLLVMRASLVVSSLAPQAAMLTAASITLTRNVQLASTMVL